jgi:exopolysaccharide production protein ExoY
MEDSVPGRQSLGDPIQRSFEINAASFEGIHLVHPLDAAVPSLDCWRYVYLKRAVDLAGSLAMIGICALPGLLITLAVSLTSKGPVFYCEQRIGRKGAPFRIWKFRTMYQNVDHLRHSKDSNPEGVVLEWRMQKHLRDPRITWIGGFLRKWSLDELPQLFNVLRGEMSFIGPRPIVAAEAVLYGGLLKYYLAATPGISGLWQVSGRSNIGYHLRAKLDAHYVETWSWRSDLAICLRTLPAVFARVGAR